MASRRSFCTEFSIPRINRLLRPLRNKCTILASCTASGQSTSAAPATITYGSTSSKLSRAPPSLDILRDPKLVISHAYLESKSLDALARQIYAVTDAYRNVVQAALTNDLDGSYGGVLSLADMCAATVGRNLQAEVVQGLTALGEETDEAMEMALSGELYDSVPMHCRRWTLVAHATSLVIDTCPNHPLLMLGLLGVALSHGLLTESEIFLRSFLIALIRPSRNGIPSAITHPMCPSYLVKLCDEWALLPPVACVGVFTCRTFAAITLEVLVEHGPKQAWTCKSVTRLAQFFRTKDFECFLSFLRGLIEAIARRSWLAVHEHDEDSALLSRLAKWTGVITSDFFSIADEGADIPSDTHAEQFNSIAEILVSAFDVGIHLQVPTDDSDDNTDLRNHQAALVCAATHCLSTPLFSQTSAQKQHKLLALLRDATPDSTTFGNIAHRPLAHLRAIAGHLRSHDLGALEVALWTCAVEHSGRVEPKTDPASHTALMDALTVAERQFYTANAGEWEWEDMVGSWVRRVSPVRVPPRKRARRETVPSRAERRRLQSRPPPPPTSSSATSRSTSVSAERTPPLSSAGPSSRSSFSTPSSPSSRSQSPFAVVVPRHTESECGSRDIRSARATRNTLTTAKLRSVLADALRMRIDLRTERGRHNSSRALRRSWSEQDEAWDDSEEPQAATTLPSEGDVLDMFAYDDDDPL
ncbi:hypothetical protein EDB83DRAFT_2425014 [Lactarius deliciosus]|nr:hypothetical protein EDB83DRAFT_2425014 [Lactarius deliciosus]